MTQAAHVNTKEKAEPNAKAMTKAMDMFNGQGRGAELSSAKGTAYGLLCSITEIIDILNCDMWSTYKADRDDLVREYGDVLTDYFLSLFSDSQSIKIIGESADYILLLKPDEIIKELEKINTFAKSQNVTFHWI